MRYVCHVCHECRTLWLWALYGDHGAQTPEQASHGSHGPTTCPGKAWPLRGEYLAAYQLGGALVVMPMLPGYTLFYPALRRRLTYTEAQHMRWQP